MGEMVGTGWKCGRRGRRVAHCFKVRLPHDLCVAYWPLLCCLLAVDHLHILPHFPPYSPITPILRATDRNSEPPPSPQPHAPNVLQSHSPPPPSPTLAQSYCPTVPTHQSPTPSAALAQEAPGDAALGRMVLNGVAGTLYAGSFLVGVALTTPFFMSMGLVFLVPLGYVLTPKPTPVPPVLYLSPLLPASRRPHPLSHSNIQPVPASSFEVDTMAVCGHAPCSAMATNDICEI